MFFIKICVLVYWFFVFFYYILNKSVVSSFRDICKRCTQQVKLQANIWNYNVAWRTGGWQFKQNGIMQQLTDVARLLFVVISALCKLVCKGIVVCRQLLFLRFNNIAYKLCWSNCWVFVWLNLRSAWYAPIFAVWT